jgi:hypothetical protein
MDERLLAAIVVAPFVITMVGFAVAIAFVPAVPNEIAPATEHDHEETTPSRQVLSNSGDGNGDVDNKGDDRSGDGNKGDSNRLVPAGQRWAGQEQAG